MFPFSENLEIESGFFAPYEKVHQKLFPLLTDERRLRIQKICQNRNFDNVIVLENIYDRGNASAVMRSAEAFGLGQMHMIEKGDKFKESQRTTAGADKWLEVRKWSSTADCIQELKSQGKKIFVTHLDSSSVPITEIDFSVPSALVLGNEKDGASAEMIAAADERIIIPMVGFVQSFNISVAGALSFYQIYLDRQSRLQKNSSLNEKQSKILEAVYALRTLDSAASILKQ